MFANHTSESLRVVKSSPGFSAEGAGLVPYTTSDTTPAVLPVSGSTAARVLGMPSLSALHNRLSRLKHHVRTASRLIKETMSRSGRRWRALFVTLTYRPGVEWSPRHVTAFIKNVRTWADRQGASLGYVWVAEMQRRGAVHYHAVVWLPSSLRLPRPDKRGWWRHGSTNVQSVKRNAVGYLMKYVSKGVTGDDPDLPAGARVCGSGGLDRMARDEFHYWRLPRYVREHIVIGDRCSRAPGGGWYSRRTGETFKSDYGLFGICLRPRFDDCNGRARRPDFVIMLSDQYKRLPSPLVLVQPHVVDALDSRRREDFWYASRELNIYALMMFAGAPDPHIP